MLLSDLRKKKKELGFVGLVIHVRNLCANEGARGLGIKKEGGLKLLRIRTRGKTWEFNFDDYRKGVKVLKQNPRLKDKTLRREVYVKYNREIRRMESNNTVRNL